MVQSLLRAQSDRGAITIIVVAAMLVLLACASLAIDVGLIWVARIEMQNAADAAALAGAAELPDEAVARTVAVRFADLNDKGNAGIVDSADVVFGTWDLNARTFAPGGNPRNAVRVEVERSPARGNALPLQFARLLGRNTTTVVADAIAFVNVGSSGPGTRFLVDEELIDSDIPVIEDLARRLGIDSEDLISDLDGDWFIDLPAGEVLSLPTGQVGDEGLFEITDPSFPFTDDSSPSYADFLNFNENGSWRQGLVPKGLLDPLRGVEPVNNPDEYDRFVDPNFCNVSPISKSDLSELNPVGGDPAVNALGERRGLLAFKVLAVGPDPDGPGGSVLPELVIEICPPVPIDDVVPPLAPGLRVVLVD